MTSDVVTLTERLVAVDTAPGRSTNPLVSLLVERGRALGAHCAVQDGEHDGVPQQNVVLRFGGDGPAGLVLAGHIDTVPWQADWRATTTAERDGTRLYGRGTCDMKGAVAAMLLAAEAERGALKRPLVLAFTYAEEIGCHGAKALVSPAAAPLLGDLSDAVCLVGEPTDLRPIVEHKGYAIAHVELSGEPAHSSDPWAGADASVALGVLLRELHGLREALRAEGGDGRHAPACTTLNTGLVTAGVARNVVPDRAKVVVELRRLPDADAEVFRTRLAACLEVALAAAPGVSGHVEWIEDNPAFAQPSGDRLVQWLVERTGAEPGVVPFYTEAEFYRVGFGAPSVVIGPGSIAQAHRVDESVAFEQLGAGEALYRDAVRAFCGRG